MKRQNIKGLQPRTALACRESYIMLRTRGEPLYPTAALFQQYPLVFAAVTHILIFSHEAE